MGDIVKESGKPVPSFPQAQEGAVAKKLQSWGLKIQEHFDVPNEFIEKFLHDIPVLPPRQPSDRKISLIVTERAGFSNESGFDDHLTATSFVAEAVGNKLSGGVIDQNRVIANPLEAFSSYYREDAYNQETDLKAFIRAIKEQNAAGHELWFSNSESLDSFAVRNFTSFTPYDLEEQKYQDLFDKYKPIIFKSAGNDSDLPTQDFSPLSHGPRTLLISAADKTEKRESVSLDTTPLTNKTPLNTLPESVIEQRTQATSTYGLPYVFITGPIIVPKDDGSKLNGTSFSAPYVASVMAEVARRHPALTFEELAFAAAVTANRDDLVTNEGFSRNKAGMDYNYGRNGFGMIDPIALDSFADVMSREKEKHDLQSEYKNFKAVIDHNNPQHDPDKKTYSYIIPVPDGITLQQLRANLRFEGNIVAQAELESSAGTKVSLPLNELGVTTVYSLAGEDVRNITLKTTAPLAAGSELNFSGTQLNGTIAYMRDKFVIPHGLAQYREPGTLEQSFKLETTYGVREQVDPKGFSTTFHPGATVAFNARFSQEESSSVGFRAAHSTYSIPAESNATNRTELNGYVQGNIGPALLYLESNARIEEGSKTKGEVRGTLTFYDKNGSGGLSAAFSDYNRSEIMLHEHLPFSKSLAAALKIGAVFPEKNSKGLAEGSLQANITPSTNTAFSIGASVIGYGEKTPYVEYSIGTKFPLLGTTVNAASLFNKERMEKAEFSVEKKIMDDITIQGRVLLSRGTSYLGTLEHDFENTKPLQTSFSLSLNVPLGRGGK